ncbi:SWIM zinc finger family protein [Alkalibacterium psychrotolerans]
MEKGGQMINLNRFESQVNATILKRGKGYYEEGFVKKVSKIVPDTFEFEVFGTETYRVKVKKDSKNNILSSCTCPYNRGKVCKHEVATFYELRTCLNRKNNVEGPDGVKNNSDRTLEEILVSLPKEELVRLITQRAAVDPSQEHHLRLQFGNLSPEDELNESKRLLQAISEKYCDYRGFIYANRTDDYAAEMGQILNRTVAIKNPLIACDIAFLVMNEALERLEYIEDDDWIIGEVVDDCIEVVKSIVSSELTVESKQVLYQKITKHLSQDSESVWWKDYQEPLFEALLILAQEESIREAYIEELMRRVKKGNSWSVRYDNERYLNQVFRLIEKTGDEDEQLLFLLNHVEYGTFRKKLIDIYTEKRDYLKVIQLAEEGERHDKEYRGSVSTWKAARYEAYKKAGMMKEQRILAKELFLAGDFDYYSDLKKLSENDESTLYLNNSYFLIETV